MPTNQPEGTSSNVRVPVAELPGAVRAAYLVRLDPAAAQGSTARYTFATLATDGDGPAAFVANPAQAGRLVVYDPPPTDAGLVAAIRAPLRFGASPRVIL